MATIRIGIDLELQADEAFERLVEELAAGLSRRGIRFDEDDELEELGRAAGFAEVRAVRRDLEPFAREVGVLDEHLSLFALPSRFLLARTRVD